MTKSRVQSGTKKLKATQDAGIAAEGVAERVRELAWSGRHAAAIELATNELDSLAGDRSKRTIALRLDLLDLRAESFVALGKYLEAAADSQAMQELATISGTQ